MKSRIANTEFISVESKNIRFCIKKTDMILRYIYYYIYQKSVEKN